MDFAAQLADLERSANDARRRPAQGGRNDFNDRPRQRQRREPEGSRSINRSPFETLQQKGYRVDPPPFLKEGIASKKPVRHICLLAVTIDELPYENIWNQWANTKTSSALSPPIVSLVCHAKYPQNIKSEFLKQHLLQEPPTVGRGTQLADPVVRSHRPEWGSVEILRAMLDILHDGLLIGNVTSPDPRYDPKRYLLTPFTSIEEPTKEEDESTTKSDDETANKETATDPPKSSKIPPADVFVFISETCLPIQPLSTWCGELDANRSWLNARHRGTPGTPRNKYELDQFAKIRMVPGECRWKADQWMALCRRHAIAVREVDNHMPERDRLWSRGFHQVNASDEMYFPTVLAVLRLLKPEEASDNDAATAATAHIEKRPVTYTDWSQGMKNPAMHTLADLPRVVTLARKQGSLIARKFSGDLDMAEWERLCNSANDDTPN